MEKYIIIVIIIGSLGLSSCSLNSFSGESQAQSNKQELELGEVERVANFVDLLSDATENKNSSLRTNKMDKVVKLEAVVFDSTDSIEDFILSPEALLLDDLTEVNDLMYYQGTLFTGSAYSLFSDGQIGEFKSYKRGMLSGPAFAWYPDGTYALQANYMDGFLYSRFLAWSEVGDVIYDLYFDKGMFQSDLQFERDTAREEQDADVAEGDADSEINSGE